VYVLGTFSVGPAGTGGVVLELGPGATGSLGSPSSPGRGRAVSRSSR
jgi:hypothetical protein